MSDCKIVKPNYYAIIPASVRYNTSLTSTAKILYGEIVALSNKEGYCWASNKFFSDLYAQSIRQISKNITLLQEKGYIVVEIEKLRDTKSTITTKRKITAVDPLLHKEWNKSARGSGINIPVSREGGSGTKVLVNNTSSNTTSIIESQDSAPDNVVTIGNNMISFLNTYAKRSYKLSQNNRKFIKSLLKQKFTEEDIKKVIIYKCGQWAGTAYEQYLRPMTLFGDKFESYLHDAKNHSLPTSGQTGNISL